MADPPVPFVRPPCLCPWRSLSLSVGRTPLSNLPPRAVSVPVPAACYLASARLISIIRSAAVHQYTESASKRKLDKSLSRLVSEAER